MNFSIVALPIFYETSTRDLIKIHKGTISLKLKKLDNER